MTENEWYKSNLGTGIGIGAVVFGFFSGIGMIDYSENKSKTAIAEAASRVEYQRLRTIEELVDKYGSTLPAKELDQFIQKYNLEGK